MKKFIKNKLNTLLTEMLGPRIDNEIGKLSDVEFAKTLPAKPYYDVLLAVRSDWGKDSDFYQSLLPLFIEDDFNYKKFIDILHNYDIYEDYMHLLNLNEDK